MRIILNGTDDIEGMAKAAIAALASPAAKASRPEVDRLFYIGLKLDGNYYSVKWNKASISVRVVP